MNMQNCPYCGAQPGTAGTIYHLPQCSQNPNFPTIVYDDPKPLGWRCPVCGRGLAPQVKSCMCILEKLVDAVENTDFDFSKVKTVSNIADIFEQRRDDNEGR